MGGGDDDDIEDEEEDDDDDIDNVVDSANKGRSCCLLLDLLGTVCLFQAS